MNTILKAGLFSMLVTATATTYAAPATQMWKCELDDDATEEEVKQMAQDWLKAARQVEGGEKFDAYVYLPVAVNDTGNSDLIFVVVAPSFADWGKFWDNYPTSAAADLEAKHNEKIVCPDSGVWETIKVE